MLVRYEATIPTAQYANIKPIIEFNLEESVHLDACFDVALSHFVEVAAKCSENPASISRNSVKK